MAQLLPPDSQGYEVAHRTGVIGQVFRRRQTLFVADGPKNRLYDTFDPAVVWELAVPLFQAGRLIGVLNLEGDEAPDLDQHQWEVWSSVVKRITHLDPPVERPEAENNHWVRTRILRFQPSSQIINELELARAATAGGADILMVGNVPHLDDGRFPNLKATLEQQLAPAESVRGLEPGIDLLPTGDLPAAEAALHWEPFTRGRYHFVFQTNQGSISTRGYAP